MKYFVYHFMSMVLFGAGCISTPNKTDKIEASASSIPVNDVSSEASENNNFTNPKVWLKPIVDHVLVRDTPSTKANEGRELEPDTWLLWTGLETTFKETIPIRGKSKPSAWMKVLQRYENQTEWVYGACVSPFVFEFDLQSDSTSIATRRWLVLEVTDSISFAMTRRKAKADTLFFPPIVKNVANNPDTTPIVILVAGREKVIRHHLCNCEGLKSYGLLSDKHGWYVIQSGYWEWGDFWFIRKKDGAEYRTMGYGYNCAPLNAPNHRLWAFPSYQGYGDIFNSGGLEIFDSQTMRSVGLQILRRENEYGVGEVTDIVWKSNDTLLFKTLNGKYFKLEIKSLFD
ncbi:MAG: hypothetical protein ACKVU0_08940 [Saprospiraceae bacterium]